MRTPVVLTLLLSLYWLIAPPLSAEVEVVFNSTRPLVDEIIYRFKEAAPDSREAPGGSIDVAIFSFTSRRLADELLRIGRDYPNVKIRVLANLSMLESPFSVIPYLENIISGDPEKYRAEAIRETEYMEDEEEEGKVKREEAIEKKIKVFMSQFRGKPIPNIEVKYHYYPGWSWNEQEGKPAYDHFHQKSNIWHHKAAVVNRETMITGSYNWSSSAEIKNLENIMIFSGPEEKHLVDDFMAEFDAMWNDPESAATGEECLRRRDKRYQEIRRERAEQDAATP
ncbi:MAG: phospholipase D-like domain-containing protein [PVC group bacterium]